jgi:hypothetical protein
MQRADVISILRERAGEVARGREVAGITTHEVDARLRSPAATRRAYASRGFWAPPQRERR